MGKIEREMRQNRPSPSIHQEVIVSLLRTTDRLMLPVGELLREADLSVSQYNVLRILRGARGEGLPCGEIAGRMVQRDPDVTRLLDRLEARGLVVRRRGESDRRVVIAAITKEGLALLERLDRPVEKRLHDVLGHLSKKELESLLGLLDRVRDRGEEP
ncbi:MAG TPA: MarR family transcriptional regulator [Thermoanaerobaculia bacterium]|nr:MarR family transcriptional regulator [Thermoanaerobaculia bacterium]